MLMLNTVESGFLMLHKTLLGGGLRLYGHCKVKVYLLKIVRHHFMK